MPCTPPISPSLQVNAFYSMHVNGIFVPAGILQPPFFTASYPMAWNYGFEMNRAVKSIDGTMVMRRIVIAT